ncbi:MAG: HD domain-containing protein [Phycisphaeraceae bacterium]|nr:MAG: HD domain-containing protein [Phycisphaeraceae bacterium]
MSGAALWQRAASYAARAHAGHVRKDGVTPYVAHPFRVAMVVRDVFGCDDTTAIAAALLHDTIEDTGTDYDELAELFGAHVADCVAALSKDMRLPEPQREPAYDEGLRRADWRAKLIKLADVYDNLCDLSGDSKKVLDKCRRAVEIAKPAATEHPAVAKGVDAVERLVAEKGEPRRH